MFNSLSSHPYFRLVTILGGITGVIVVTKILISHHKRLLTNQSSPLPSSPSSTVSFASVNSSPAPSSPTRTRPFANSAKLKEYYDFILQTLKPESPLPSNYSRVQDNPSKELIHQQKIALDILKFFSGFNSEHEIIREKGLIPVLLNFIKTSHAPEVQSSSAFIISNISMQQRNHQELNDLQSIDILFDLAKSNRSNRTDALQLLLNLSFHPQNISKEIIEHWDAVHRVSLWLETSTHAELVLALKVLINLSYIPFYAQQMKFDEDLSKRLKQWSVSTHDEIRPRAILLRENLK